jgi:hypothetical protein
LRRVWLVPERFERREDYPFCLPIVTGFPDARLLRLTPHGFEPTTLRETDHFRLMSEFCADPDVFLDTMMNG